MKSVGKFYQYVECYERIKGHSLNDEQILSGHKEFLHHFLKNHGRKGFDDEQIVQKACSSLDDTTISQFIAGASFIKTEQAKEIIEDTKQEIVGRTLGDVLFHFTSQHPLFSKIIIIFIIVSSIWHKEILHYIINFFKT